MNPSELPTKKIVTLDFARAIAEAALGAAVSEGLNKLVIAVVDDGGRLIHFLRQDDAEPAAIDIGIAKARTAAIFTRATKHWKELLLDGKLWVLGMPNMVPVEGGLPILVDGKTIGGLGVAGGSGELDTRIGLTALSACGAE